MGDDGEPAPAGHLIDNANTSHCLASPGLIPSKAVSDPPLDSLDQTIRGRWHTIAPHTDTIADHPRGTITPGRLEGPASTGGLAAMQALAGLGGVAGVGSAEEDAPPGRRTARSLTLEGTIGQGGMGVVRLGTQQTLGRKVAIKTLRDDVSGDGPSLALLREAWVTGGLEHPNVMPVYDMGLDDSGRPLVVLKRIEGTHWGELMHRRDLAWNLEIMLQVCNALRFAHSRGILHRDIKPENVMIGEFGEVYLLDWGIAVSLEDDESGRRPLARDATEMAGTPCYMAPEMLGGDGTHLSRSTDVYLLGAVLYEVLAGHPPHQGEEVMDIVRSVILSQVRPPPNVPAELADIVTRACAPEPEDRFTDVDTFQHALETHLAHRGALALIDRAELTLAKLLAELDRADAPRTELYDRFGAIRFGFRQALEQWPGAEPARRGLDNALTAMARWELAQGDLRAAELHVAELGGDVPADLAEALAAALAAQAEERRRIAQLEHLKKDWDPQAGKRTRLFLVMLMGSVWTALPLLQWHGPLQNSWASYRGLLTWSAIMTGLMVILGVWAWESMSKSAINRALMRAGLLTPTGMFLIHLGCWLRDVDPMDSQLMTQFWWSGLTLMLASYVDSRLFPTAIGYLLAFLFSAAFPDWRFAFMSVSNLILTINAIIIWKPSAWTGDYT